VECASIHDFLNALAHDGLEVPCTHAYKHRRVTPVVHVPDAERLPLHTLSPSLEMQLAPLPTPELERRLAAAERRDTSEEGDARDAKRAKTRGDSGNEKASDRCKITRHLRLCRELASSMRFERPTRNIDGVRLDAKGETYAGKLLDALRAFDRWPEDSKKRKGVGAAAYAVIKRKDVDKIIAREGTSPETTAAVGNKVVELFRLAQATLNVACGVKTNEGDEQIPFDAVAVTRAFRGSPHVDARDTSHQYVLALGDFSDGGALCVEEVAEEKNVRPEDPGDARDTGDAGDGDPGWDGAGRGKKTRDGERRAPPRRFVPTGHVLRVNVKNRVARIDGRHVHWVDGWSGERFSVVFFCTRKENAAEMQATAAHEEWMAAKQREKKS
jgi:hypothetical protein